MNVGFAKLKLSGFFVPWWRSQFVWLILFFSPFFFSFLSFWTNKLGLVVWSWQRLLATFPSRWPTQWMASSNYYCHSCHSPCRSIFTSPRVNLSSLFAQTVYKLRKYQHYYKIKKQCPQKTKTKGEKKGGGGGWGTSDKINWCDCGYRKI